VAVDVSACLGSTSLHLKFFKWARPDGLTRARPKHGPARLPPCPCLARPDPVPVPRPYIQPMGQHGHGTEIGLARLWPANPLPLDEH
jgi:hypothetical protein